MKKKYMIPATKVICLRSTAQLLTTSPNEFSNNQGHIHFESDEVSADDAD